MYENKIISRYLGLLLLLFFSTVVINREEISTIIVCAISFISFLPYIINNRFLIPRNLFTGAIIISLLLIINCLVNSTNPLYPAKYISYIIIALAGYVVGYQNFRISIGNNYFIIVIVASIVGFIVFHTANGGGFFQLKNTYVYFGLMVALLYYLAHLDEERSLLKTSLILLVYVFTATNLGILFAIIMAFALYSMNKVKRVVMSIAFLLLLILLITYVDLPVFVRIRGVFDLALSIPVNEYLNMKDTSLYELMQLYGTGNEQEGDSSFAFRLIHWSKILTSYFSSDLLHILAGHGDMAVKETFGLQSHNEYVKIIYENGIFVCGLFVAFVVRLFRQLKNMKFNFLVVSPLLFMFTENLLLFTYINFFIFLIVGYFFGLYNYLDNTDYE